VLGVFSITVQYSPTLPRSQNLARGTGKLLWHALEVKTLDLIHEHVHVEAVRDDLETQVMDAEVLAETKTLRVSENP
jgi:type I restriction enzyme R subunit